MRAVQGEGKQAAIAVAMGVSESTVSRLLSDHLDKLAHVLALAGLKVVPAEMQCYHPEKIGALLTLARDHLASIERADQLTWE